MGDLGATRKLHATAVKAPATSLEFYRSARLLWDVQINCMWQMLRTNLSLTVRLFDKVAGGSQLRTAFGEKPPTVSNKTRGRIQWGVRLGPPQGPSRSTGPPHAF